MFICTRIMSHHAFVHVSLFANLINLFFFFMIIVLFIANYTRWLTINITSYSLKLPFTSVILSWWSRNHNLDFGDQGIHEWVTNNIDTNCPSGARISRNVRNILVSLLFHGLINCWFDVSSQARLGKIKEYAILLS